MKVHASIRLQRRNIEEQIVKRKGVENFPGPLRLSSPWNPKAQQDTYICHGTLRKTLCYKQPERKDLTPKELRSHLKLRKL